MKRAQVQNKNAESPRENVESCFFKQLKETGLHPSVLKQARRSGQLNLSGRGMSQVPDIVWNINMLSGEEVKSLSLSMTGADNDQWWDYVDLTKLLLASNVLTSISPDIKNLPALVTLDLHDNALSTLPDSLSELKHIKKLDLSRNHFVTLPSCIFQLKNLQVLLVQRNDLKELDDDIGNLSLLQELDLSYNKLSRLPHCIGFLSRVTMLNISENELTSIPFEIGDLTAIRRLEFSSNKIESLPDSIGKLHHMEQLYLHHNKLNSLPPLSECTSLKEIHCGFNCINELSSDFLEQFVCLKYLDLRDNKISEIPDNIAWLQSLEVLHLSNNNLSSLPFTMGTLPHLKILTIDGNPMRSIRRDIIQRGTVHLLKWLQSRMAESPPKNGARPRSAVDGCAGHNSSPEVDRYALKATKSLNYSNRGMLTIPDDVVSVAIEAEITVADLSKNSITDLPPKMETFLPKLTELNLGFNKLELLPGFISAASCLQFLDIRNNRVQDLPEGLSSMEQLREINLAFNRFKKVPSVLYKLKKLEIVIASDNQIEEIDVAGLLLMPVLSVLDLHNNNIAKVPPELGNVTQLRSLLLEGNLFKNPRLAVLSRGTNVVLEFLRNQIVQQT